MENKGEKVELLHGYCNPKCIYFEERDMPTYVPPYKSKIQLCTYGGNARSFGCMNGCLNGIPEFKKIEENNGQEV